jgi:phosphatidylinositol alpha 1,6-mannosyltransferase
VSVPRVAFFADSFHEVNGVARTSREFTRFAKEREYPFFSVHTGPETQYTVENIFETYELSNSRTVIRLQADLSFDLLFLRHRARLATALSRFHPDLVHITGPSHCGFLGAILAHDLKVPLVASWHTNLHEYAARRLATLLPLLPARLRKSFLQSAEDVSLSLILHFYRLARLLFAPNPELIDLLSSRIHRPTYPMQRGIDADLFSPLWRERSDSTFVIGYVGRLSSEKNVRMLAELEQLLLAQGLSDYRFLIVGDGIDRPWLAAHMRSCELPGALLGTELAKAYAGMDAFVFPSTTDTFGNVVLESMASGVPTIVSSGGGPKFLVNSGSTGFVAKDLSDYSRYILLLHRNPALRREISGNARRAACAFSWAAVFDRVYQVYGEAIASGLISRRALSSAGRAVLSSVA